MLACVMIMKEKDFGQSACLNILQTGLVALSFT